MKMWFLVFQPLLFYFDPAQDVQLLNRTSSEKFYKYLKFTLFRDTFNFFPHYTIFSKIMKPPYHQVLNITTVLYSFMCPHLMPV